jgi:hypothetical protein
MINFDFASNSPILLPLKAVSLFIFVNAWLYFSLDNSIVHYKERVGGVTFENYILNIGLDIKQLIHQY